jgi:RiboL-PSP-HEPN
MRSRPLISQQQRLEWLMNQASIFPSDQLELQAHWARYLCVLTAGFLENALSEVYSRYAKASANVEVSNFVEAVLEKIQNPKASRFLDTARAFDRAWEDDLKIFMSENGRKDAIDAIMANRHLIAHGKDSGISLVRVKDYLSKSIEVIEFIEVQCGLTL